MSGYQAGAGGHESSVAFLSLTVREKLCRDPTCLNQVPLFDETFAVVLYVDISGFTKLGRGFRKEFGQDRQIAAEKLADIIQLSLGSMTQICMDHQGDVVKFAGDALVCAWNLPRKRTVRLHDKKRGTWKHHRGEQDILNTTAEAYITLARNAAIQMFRTIREKFGLLDLHGGIAFGPVQHIYLGKRDKKYEEESMYWHVLNGQAMKDAYDLLDKSMKGEILLKTDSGEESLNEHSEVRRSTHVVETRNLDEWVSALGEKPDTMVKVKRFIPNALRLGLSGGVVAGGEICRDVAIMFVKVSQSHLEDLENPNRSPKKSLKKLNSDFRSLCTSVRWKSGEIRDFLVDDKGFIFIGVFGTHYSLENPALNCVLAAKEIIRKNKHCSIGISLGTCWAGMAGTRERHDYVVVGHEVNQAARYCSGGKLGDVIVSPHVAEVLKEDVGFEATSFQRDKKRKVVNDDGVAHLVMERETFNCFKLKNATRLGDRVRNNLTRLGDPLKSPVASKTVPDFIGRKKEMERLHKFIFDEGGPSFIEINGDAGMGKSVLLVELEKSLNKKNVICLFNEGKAETRPEHLLILKMLIVALLALKYKDIPPNPQQFNLEKIKHDPQMLRKLKLVQVKDRMGPNLRSSVRKGSKMSKKTLEANFRKNTLALTQPRARFFTNLGTGLRKTFLKSKRGSKYNSTISEKITSPDAGAVEALSDDEVDDDLQAAKARNGSKRFGRVPSKLSIYDDDDQDTRLHRFQLEDFALDITEKLLIKRSKDHMEDGMGPLVVIVDDIHLCDSASAWALLELARNNEIQTKFVFSASNPTKLRQRHPDTHSEYGSWLRGNLIGRNDKYVGERIELQRMTTKEVHELAFRILRRHYNEHNEPIPSDNPGSHLTRELKNEVEKFSGCVPGNIKPLLDYFIAEELVQYNKELTKFILPTDVAKIRRKLPKTIGSVASKKIRRLDSREKNILRLAAVIGKSFKVGDVWKLSQMDESPHTEAFVFQVLTSLLEKGVFGVDDEEKLAACKRSLVDSDVLTLGFSFLWELLYHEVRESMPRGRLERLQKLWLAQV